MPNSAAYRRPRCANSSDSRNVIAIGESLSVWYQHGITASWNASTKPRVHRYAAFFVVPVPKYISSGVR
jgi:hypothetical protein